MARIFLILLLAVPSLSVASEDQKLGQAYCVSGFAESSISWSSSYFLPKCKQVKSSPEGKCIEGFASSPRQWNADDFFKVCSKVTTISEASCIFGFAKSARNWNGKFFLERCKALR